MTTRPIADKLIGRAVARAIEFRDIEVAQVTLLRLYADGSSPIAGWDLHSGFVEFNDGSRLVRDDDGAWRCQG